VSTGSVAFPKLHSDTLTMGLISTLLFSGWTSILEEGRPRPSLIKVPGSTTAGLEPTDFSAHTRHFVCKTAPVQTNLVASMSSVSPPNPLPPDDSVGGVLLAITCILTAFTVITTVLRTWARHDRRTLGWVRCFAECCATGLADANKRRMTTLLSAAVSSPSSEHASKLCLSSMGMVAIDGI